MVEDEYLLVHSGEGKNVGLQKGFYTHWRGDMYEVLDVAMHSETKEQYVVYRSCGHGNVTWIRPSWMFISDVVLDSGERVKRFQYVSMLKPKR